MKWNKKKGKIRAEANDLLFSIDADNKASYRNRNGAWVSESFSSVEAAKEWCETRRSDEHIAFLEESLRLNDQRLVLLEEQEQKDLDQKLVNELIKHPEFNQIKKVWDAYVSLPGSIRPMAMSVIVSKYGEQSTIASVMQCMIAEDDFLKGVSRWTQEWKQKEEICRYPTEATKEYADNNGVATKAYVDQVQEQHMLDLTDGTQSTGIIGEASKEEKPIAATRDSLVLVEWKTGGYFLPRIRPAGEAAKDQL